CRIHKFDNYVSTYTLNIPIRPLLKWVSLRGASALLGGPLIHTTGGLRGNLIRRSVHDIHPPAICFPPGKTRSEPLVGVCDAAVAFFLEFRYQASGRAAIRTAR